MSKLDIKADITKSQAKLSRFVLTLTIMVIIFSTYMSASFWAGLGVNKHSSLMFSLLGMFLEMAKVCAGIALVFSHATKSINLRVISMSILVIFTMVSFVASVGSISEQISSGKINAYNASTDVKNLNAAILRQGQIIDALLLSQKNDIENGYRARSNSTLIQIKEEQNKLEGLQDRLSRIKIINIPASKMILIFDRLIPIGQDHWEQIVVLVLGALTEIAGLFLLYLIFSLRYVKTINKETQSVKIYSNKKQTKQHVLPISLDEYHKITTKIISGAIAPTQRDIKNEVHLGNEKIAKIFAQWVHDGVLIKAGKSYRVAA